MLKPRLFWKRILPCVHYHFRRQVSTSEPYSPSDLSTCNNPSSFFFTCRSLTFSTRGNGGIYNHTVDEINALYTSGILFTVEMRLFACLTNVCKSLNVLATRMLCISGTISNGPVSSCFQLFFKVFEPCRTCLESSDKIYKTIAVISLDHEYREQCQFQTRFQEKCFSRETLLTLAVSTLQNNWAVRIFDMQRFYLSSWEHIQKYSSQHT